MAAFDHIIKKKYLIPLFLFFISLGIYISTLCPTVYLGDSGEFITNAYTLGINHPTGYPFYTVLTRFFILLTPFASPTYGTNLFSALCAALTIPVFYSTLRLLTDRTMVSAVSALLYAVSATLWSKSSSAEVYGMNILFISLAVYWTFHWYQKKDTRNLLLVSFIAGLGLSQHVTGVLVALSILLFLVVSNWRILFHLNFLGASILLFLIGFSCYLYLPIRSMANPPLDWGNPETLQNLAQHFFPKAPGSLFFSAPKYQTVRIAWTVTQVFTKEFWYFGGLGIVGLLFLLREWRLWTFLSSIAALNLYFSFKRFIPLHADFDASLMPTYFIMAIGIGTLLAKGQDLFERTLPAVQKPLLTRLAGMLLMIVPVIILLQNWKESDKHNNYFAYDLGKNIYSAAPANSIFFTVGDEQTFLGYYLKHVDRSLAQATIIDKNLLGAAWGGPAMCGRELGITTTPTDPSETVAKQIISHFLGRRDIYFVNNVPWNFVVEQYDVEHNGMLIKVLPKGSKFHYAPPAYTFHLGWEDQFLDPRAELIQPLYPREYLDNANFWYLKGNKEASLNELGEFLKLNMKKTPEQWCTAYLMLAQMHSDFKKFDTAVVNIDSALAYQPTDWRCFEARGNIFYLMGKNTEALASWKQALLYNPKNEKLQRNVEILSTLKQ
ncbi:MAG: DUF2723 domain-containing protein [bacterium]